MTRNVAILIFDDVEVLDFAGPFEVFGVTGAFDAERPFNVFTVAENPGPVLARNGLSINPAYTIHTCPLPDIVLVPGGRGTRREMHNPVLLEWIAAHARKPALTLSVCTGALMLAKANLLDGLAATTYHTELDTLAQLVPTAQVRRDARYVDNGLIITSAGVSAGIDMALYVVGKLLGVQKARETAQYMEYGWSA